MNLSTSAIHAMKRALPGVALSFLLVSGAVAQDGGQHAKHHPRRGKAQAAEKPASQPASQPAKGGMMSGKGMMSGGMTQGKGMMDSGMKEAKARHMMKKMAHMKKRDDDRKKKRHDLDDMLGEAPKSLKKHHKKTKHGVPHLYHIAAENFLLDKKDRLDLSDEQKHSLLKIVEETHLTLATHHRKIEQAEQELWVLTGKDKPDASSVEAKMKEIAELKVAKRMAFFKAVEKAVGVLTDEQRDSLLKPMEKKARATSKRGSSERIKLHRRIR